MASASFTAVETVRPVRMLLPEHGVMKHATDIRMTGTALEEYQNPGAGGAGAAEQPQMHFCRSKA